MHLVGFTAEMYYDARPYEGQKYYASFLFRGIEHLRHLPYRTGDIRISEFWSWNLIFQAKHIT